MVLINVEHDVSAYTELYNISDDSRPDTTFHAGRLQRGVSDVTVGAIMVYFERGGQLSCLVYSRWLLAGGYLH